MRSLFRALLLTLPLLFQHSLGQAAAQAELESLREQIEQGSWQSVAFVSGPALVARYPNERAAHFLVARALLLLGEVSAASEALDRADQLSSSGIPAEHRHLRGLILAQQGEAAAGAEAIRSAFNLQPLYRYAMDWGRIAWQAGDWAGAEAAFTAAGQTDDGLVEPWPALARGRLLAAQGRHEEAVRAFLTALHRYEAHDSGEPRLPGPAYVEAWYRLGITYEALGQLDQAVSAYRTARNIDPNHGPSVLAFDRLSRRGD
jgi:tetratricopeptide (TPR) repeat protein